jgi:hypothetical protein
MVSHAHGCTCRFLTGCMQHATRDQKKDQLHGDFHAPWWFPWWFRWWICGHEFSETGYCTRSKFSTKFSTCLCTYPYASLNRTLFWTERSAASWHAPGIFVSYVDLVVFHRALCDRGLNSIPKWYGTPMARGLRLQRSTIGNRSEASRWKWVGNFAVNGPICENHLSLNSGSVLIVFNSSLTSETSISTRSTYFILWMFLPDRSKLSGFRPKMTGHHQISWRRRNFVYHQKYRTASSICTCFVDQELVSYIMRCLLHFTKVYLPKRAVIDAPMPTRAWAFGSLKCR